MTQISQILLAVKLVRSQLGPLAAAAAERGIEIKLPEGVDLTTPEQADAPRASSVIAGVGLLHLGAGAAAAGGDKDAQEREQQVLASREAVLEKVADDLQDHYR